MVKAGFKALHSAECALQGVSNDLLLAVDLGNCSVFLFLNTCADHFTVDSILG